MTITSLTSFQRKIIELESNNEQLRGALDSLQVGPLILSI
jgi:hypothetical protein